MSAAHSFPSLILLLFSLFSLLFFFSEGSRPAAGGRSGSGPAVDERAGAARRMAEKASEAGGDLAPVRGAPGAVEFLLSVVKGQHATTVDKTTSTPLLVAAKLSGSRAACAYDVAEVCVLSYKSHVISASGFRLRPFTPPEDDAAHVVDVLDALTGAVERDGQQVTRGGLLEHRRHARGAPGRGTYWEPARDDAGETTHRSTRHPLTAPRRRPPSPKKRREKREKRREEE
uniref:Uncharacterized protein n=1 Tax=Oryza sativa subsp. japonica TaxID=39947 RepID=Q6ZGY9_ORYSJ|nr:hypothetical protein [Oryza sativa Japonica Group]